MAKEYLDYENDAQKPQARGIIIKTGDGTRAENPTPRDLRKPKSVSRSRATEIPGEGLADRLALIFTTLSPHESTERLESLTHISRDGLTWLVDVCYK
jgi:hypothetical protein